MIQIFPLRQSALNTIKEVYTDKLIPAILKKWRELPSSQLIELSPQRALNTEEDREDFLLEFLLSKQFYDYKFIPYNSSGFWYDLAQLSGKCYIDSILGKRKTNSENILRFRQTYSMDEWNDYYKELIPYSGGEHTLSMFKQSVKSDPEKNPRDPLEIVFSYDLLSDDLRHTLINAMDVPVCPYCNMNYTISYRNQDSSKTTADLDHFYVKSEHPEYSLCLFNMIPSCPVCNSRLKLDCDMTIDKYIYPHQNSFADHAAFYVDNIPQCLLNKETIEVFPNIILDIFPDTDQKISNKIKSSADLFQLEARYQSVQSYAKELIDKAQIYTDNYNEELESQFCKVFGGASIRDMVFGPKESEEQYARRSLGKLRMDLLKQLKIY